MVASLVALQLSVAGVLVRLRVPSVAALLAATVVTYFGPGSEEMVYQNLFPHNFALALALAAAFVALGLRRDRTTAIVVAALSLAALPCDSARLPAGCSSPRRSCCCLAVPTRASSHSCHRSSATWSGCVDRSQVIVPARMPGVRTDQLRRARRRLDRVHALDPHALGGRPGRWRRDRGMDRVRRRCGARGIGLVEAVSVEADRCRSRRRCGRRAGDRRLDGILARRVLGDTRRRDRFARRRIQSVRPTVGRLLDGVRRARVGARRTRSACSHGTSHRSARRGVALNLSTVEHAASTSVELSDVEQDLRESVTGRRGAQGTQLDEGGQPLRLSFQLVLVRDLIERNAHPH
jgi:hypothetical protein